MLTSASGFEARSQLNLTKHHYFSSIIFFLHFLHLTVHYGRKLSKIANTIKIHSKEK